MTGRFHHNKRPDIALKAIGHVQSRLSDRVHLVFAGFDEENLKPSLIKLSRENNLENNVHFTGMLTGNQIYEILADADLLVMPTSVPVENFGMAALEALAAGLPIITSEFVPVGRMAAQNGAGVIAPLEAAIFGDEIYKLLVDTNKRLDMGRRGQTFAYENFDISIVANQMIEQYHAIIETGKPELIYH
jgi:glycosyltransferase involved in cell wall biosynthesis